MSADLSLPTIQKLFYGQIKALTIDSGTASNSGSFLKISPLFEKSGKAINSALPVSQGQEPSLPSHSPSGEFSRINAEKQLSPLFSSLRDILLELGVDYVETG